jgi:hypothetical protein
MRKGSQVDTADTADTLDSTTYNRFAQSLVERIAERATGRDDASARIVNIRPADHVLAGFLTPARRSADQRPRASNRRHATGSGSTSTTASDGEDQDLPDDSPYEQSTLGLEWLLPRAVAGLGLTLHITVTGALYARTLPDQAELTRHARWVRADRQQRRARSLQPVASGASMPAADAPVPAPRRAEIVHVWTRIDLPPLELAIRLDDVLADGRLEQPLTAQVNQAWQTWAREHVQELYPRVGHILLWESDCSADGYEQWRRASPPNASALGAAGWQVVVDVRTASVATEPDCLRMSLRVINKTPIPQNHHVDYVDPNVYAVRIRVQLPGGAHRPTEFADLPRSYRYDREIAAVGINADVHVVPASSVGVAPHDAGATDSVVLETESVPQKRVDRLEPRQIQGAEPTFAALQRDPIPVLRRILDEMRAYDASTWTGKIARLTGAALDEATDDRQRFRTQEIEAFTRGIALLQDANYPLVLRAFQLMNRVMHDYAGGAYDAWRLFQVVFIVTQLPRLAARHYPELSEEGDDAVEILWFAAGGGKTEAFLGLLVWHIFFDRLRGKTLGTTAMLRFPLRLLAFQQLQRMSRVLAHAELVRRQEGLGGFRFSLGYFVGDNTRPNSIDDARHARYSAHLPDHELRSLMRCPFCGSAVELNYRRELRLVEHFCSNRAACPGGAERLPLYVVDYDIYYYLPTVIISTVDKLAILGQNRRFANLFGRFDLVCGTHGASFRDARRECPAAVAYAKHPDDPAARMRTCGGKPVYYADDPHPFVDPAPALLVQDELHLLSEEMGTFDAHYETAAMEMLRSLGAKPWKIIGATATIERYEHHVEHLYLKQARQFPCPGPAAYDSFYYHVDPQRIGRIFVGVLGVGRKHTPAVTRLQSLIYRELQTARDLAAEDVASACARYDLPTLSRRAFEQLIFCYELVLTYVLTRKGSDQVAEAIRSRVRRELDELMPSHGALLLEMFNGQVDTPTMLAAMEEIELARYDASTPDQRVRGVVATNIISHGIDINRFNIMVFAGFTRLIAEYIQASARVGRTFPGISFLVVTPQSERDRSIFERFAKFHEYLDRMVDPSAINRWPPQALTRTVGGILAGYLMAVAAHRMGRRIESLQHFQSCAGGAGAEALREEDVLAWMARALGTVVAPFPEYHAELERAVRNKYGLLANSPVYESHYDGLNQVLGAMRSLRDVDDPAAIRVTRRQTQDRMHNLGRA